MYEALKRFRVGDTEYAPGDKANAEGWKNLDVLIRNGYVRPAEAVLEPVETGKAPEIPAQPARNARHRSNVGSTPNV